MNKATNEPILTFLVNYLWRQMPDPNSPFFLPRMLGQQAHQYDPYHVDAWDLGTLPQSNDAACISGTTAGSCVGYPSLRLTDVVVKGLYNLKPGADMPVITDTNVKGTLNFNQLAPGPYVTSQYLTIIGRYRFDQKCKTDSTPEQDFGVEGTGTFTAQVFIAQGTIDMNIDPDPAHPGQLMVTVNKMELIAPPDTGAQKLCKADGAARNSNICISVQMDSGPDFNFLANQAANYKKVSTAIIDNINNTLSSPGTLSDISNMLTQQVNHIFSSGVYA
ncbi:hypothetical protein EPD60_12295 [Flaviaesturariibacter flavus]|uniref:Uncharacterized protein n=1 Tax=Flaviaesturariibacter flavus TaxID=2502780 RepID=A0A4R1B9H8_9BACT|nr:hypothetical protein [Flaviaesturariibacter flavus]TCJ13571.1 hypothetical protein EPD60_12295 [Flaviaesturariibacter flavus]